MPNVITLELDMRKISASVRLKSAMERKIGEPLAMYINTFAAALNSSLQAASLAGPETRAEVEQLMTANFMAAMIMMDAPEWSNVALQASLNCMLKANDAMQKWIEGMAREGVQPHEIPEAQQQMLAYVEKNLDLSEEISMMENL